MKGDWLQMMHRMRQLREVVLIRWFRDSVETLVLEDERAIVIVLSCKERTK